MHPSHPHTSLPPSQGYALVEYELFKEANAAIDSLNGSNMLGQQIEVDWAFIKPQAEGRAGRRYAHAHTHTHAYTDTYTHTHTHRSKR